MEYFLFNMCIHFVEQRKCDFLDLYIVISLNYAMLFQDVGAEGCTADPINLVCYKNCTQEADNDSHDCYCDQPVNQECQQCYNIIVNFNITSTILCERSTPASTTMLLCTTLSSLPTASHHTLHSPYFWYNIISIAVLGSTNILLVIVVILCSISLCFVKQRRTARHRYMMIISNFLMHYYIMHVKLYTTFSQTLIVS